VVAAPSAIVFFLTNIMKNTAKKSDNGIFVPKFVVIAPGWRE
jgi:hypothetical protein